MELPPRLGSIIGYIGEHVQTRPRQTDPESRKSPVSDLFTATRGQEGGKIDGVNDETMADPACRAQVDS